MTAKMPPLVPNLTQFALRFAVVSDATLLPATVWRHASFQSALRFAVVSDGTRRATVVEGLVSIRFEVRGGFRHGLLGKWENSHVSIRFKVRGGFRLLGPPNPIFSPSAFQSALRFAVVSDTSTREGDNMEQVSIRFEVRGGFRPRVRG